MTSSLREAKLWERVTPVAVTIRRASTWDGGWLVMDGVENREVDDDVLAA